MDKKKVSNLPPRTATEAAKPKARRSSKVVSRVGKIQDAAVARAAAAKAASASAFLSQLPTARGRETLDSAVQQIQNGIKRGDSPAAVDNYLEGLARTSLPGGENASPGDIAEFKRIAYVKAGVPQPTVSPPPQVETELKVPARKGAGAAKPSAAVASPAGVAEVANAPPATGGPAVAAAGEKLVPTAEDAFAGRVHWKALSNKEYARYAHIETEARKLVAEAKKAGQKMPMAEAAQRVIGGQAAIRGEQRAAGAVGLGVAAKIRDTKSMAADARNAAAAAGGPGGNLPPPTTPPPGSPPPHRRPYRSYAPDEVAKLATARHPNLLGSQMFRASKKKQFLGGALSVAKKEAGKWRNWKSLGGLARWGGLAATVAFLPETVRDVKDTFDWGKNAELEDARMALGFSREEARSMTSEQVVKETTRRLAVQGLSDYKLKELAEERTRLMTSEEPSLVDLALGTPSLTDSEWVIGGKPPNTARLSEFVMHDLKSSGLIPSSFGNGGP